MDPNVSDPASQNTLPQQDPATLYHLVTEVSSQASMLAAHQQQLLKLTSLTEELVRTMRTLTPPSAASAPPAAASAHPDPSLNLSNSNPRLSLPDKFDGTVTKCRGFLLQCSLFMNQQPHLYSTDDSKVSFLCSLLTGKALDWATAIWEGGRMTFPSYANF